MRGTALEDGRRTVEPRRYPRTPMSPHPRPCPSAEIYRATAAARSAPVVRVAVLVAVLLAPLVAVTVLGPVAHGPSFHRYADARTLLGVPHALDVLSNLGFVIAGVWALGVTRPVSDPLLR